MMKIKGHSFVFLAMLVAFASNANAKLVGHYEAQVEVEDSNEFGKIFALLSGWNCSGSTTASYRETVNNHKGKSVSIEKESSSSWSYETAYDEPNTNISFARDYYQKNPRLNVNVRNTCTHSELDPCASIKTNSDGSTQCEPGWKTETSYLGWSCEFSDLPEMVEGRVDQVCVPYNSGISSYSLQGQLLGLLKQKTVRASIVLREKNEEVLYTNCNGKSGERAFLLNLSQGVGGHTGEDDFEFTVRLDSPQGSPITIKSTSGLISGDIRYCADDKQSSVKLYADAVERDWLSDDVYPTVSAEIQLLGGTSQDLIFGRRKSTMSLMTAKKSALKVKVIDLRNDIHTSGQQ